MKYFKLFFICSAILVGLASCEEVIVLDLANTEPRVVIEGIVTDQPGPYRVTIRKTADFYEPSVFPAGTGAIVRISDSEGNEDTLQEIEDGVYQTTNLQGVAGYTYNLTVAFEGEVYRASSTIPANHIPIDSLAYEFEEESVFNDEGYFVTSYFTDLPGVRNYFRLNIFVNGAPYLFENDDDEFIEDNNFWLIDDKYFEGNQIDYDFPLTLVEGDSVYVELHNLDKSTYDYYITLVQVIDGGGLAPSNPITNLSNNALGYFGAFSVDSASIVVVEE